MTNQQQTKIEKSLTSNHYSAYRKNMWCKQIGFTLWCFDFENMHHYMLKNNIIYHNEKIRANINTNKLTELIRKNENNIFKL